MNKYWTKKDASKAKSAETFEKLAEVALRIIDRMPQPVEMVCGPLTSGGLGSLTKNTKAFRKYIKKLASEGRIVFDQLPFEPHLHRIAKSARREDENRLLEGFYGSIFKSGKIEKLVFIPGWQSSAGATWERKMAKKLKIAIKDL